MTNWGILLFVGASGFTLSGLLYALHASATHDQPGFRLSFRNPAATGWSVILCLLAGPYIIISNALRYWREGLLPGSILAFCTALSVLWSFCSGVFVVQALHLTGLITV